MTHNSGFTGRALARLALVVLALILGASTLSAQGVDYPQFTGQEIPAIQTSGSPAIAGDNTYLYIAYSDATNNGYLTYGYSGDGVNFTLTQTNFQMYSDPALAVDAYSNPGSTSVYLAFQGASQDILTYTFTAAGSISLLTDYTPGSTLTGSRPALATAQDPTYGYDDIYLAWEGSSYDPSTGTFDGQWINVAYSHGGSFSPYGSSITPVSEAYTAGSGPALTIFQGLVYLDYLDAATTYAHLFLASQGSTSFSETSGSGGIGQGNGYAHDPALSQQGGYVFAGFGSAFSEDNLWMVGIADNGTGFLPNVGYTSSPEGNISFTNSTTLAYVGYVGSGTLYEAARTNFPSHGQYVWVYNSPYLAFDPYDEGGGGGGGGGSNPCPNDDSVVVGKSSRAQPNVRPICPPLD